jgi:hypothetical protein
MTPFPMLGLMCPEADASACRGYGSVVSELSEAQMDVLFDPLDPDISDFADP